MSDSPKAMSAHLRAAGNRVSRHGWHGPHPLVNLPPNDDDVNLVCLHGADVLDELVAVLKFAVEGLERSRKRLLDVVDPAEFVFADLDNRIASARAALAKARGEPNA